MSQTNESTLIKLYLNIEVIAHYQDGQVINMSGENLVACNKNYYTSLCRKINGETRYKCFNKIKDTINYAIVITELLINSKYLCDSPYIRCDNKTSEYYINWINKFLDCLALVNDGLYKYTQAYHDDNEFVIEINQLINEVDYKKKYLEELYKGIEFSSVV